jgi:hypothetical protein
VRAIAVVKQIGLTDNLRNIRVLGNHPEWIKAFGFDSTKRLVRAQPPKPGKKRFLLCISFRRGDQASEALGYFFNLRHFRVCLSYLAVAPSRILPQASAAC